MDKTKARAKFAALLSLLEKYESLVVAFSGGVDSTLLLAAAKKALGGRVLAVSSVSSIHPEDERAHAVEMAGRLGVRQRLIDTGEMQMGIFRANDPDRCYHCKKRLFSQIWDIARKEGMDSVAHGANRDDLEDYRPGFRAADEFSVRAPLVDAGLDKPEIRCLAADMGLSNWNRPAMACLATRIPYGERITASLLKRIERAEAYLAEKGFSGNRVRCVKGAARIEVDEEDMTRFLEGAFRAGVVDHFRALGFEHVSMDLEGRIPGKMNRGLRRGGGEP